MAPGSSVLLGLGCDWLEFNGGSTDERAEVIDDEDSAGFVGFFMAAKNTEVSNVNEKKKNQKGSTFENVARSMLLKLISPTPDTIEYQRHAHPALHFQL